MLDYIAALLGTSKTTVVAGGAGAAVAALLSKRQKLEKGITFVVGFFFATFTTAPIIDLLNLESVRFQGGLGFVLGLFGMGFTEAVIKTIKDTDWSEIIKGRLGK